MPTGTLPERRIVELTAPVRQRFARFLGRLLTPIVEEAIVSAMRKGEGPLVAIPADEYDSYRETADVLDDPDALADLEASDEDERAGRVYDYGELRAELGLGETPPHAEG